MIKTMLKKQKKKTMRKYIIIYNCWMTPFFPFFTILDFHIIIIIMLFTLTEEALFRLLF